MKITQIEQNPISKIEKGKSFSSTVYYYSALITLEDGVKTSYLLRESRLTDLKAKLAKMPYGIQGAELDNNNMVLINYGSNLL